jgi:glycyl-tRNA synthetase beta chain
MSEFLLELYSEEIPPQLQINARTQLKQQLENSLKEQGIQYKDFFEYSSPTRLSIYIKGVPQNIKINSKDFTRFC